MLLVLVEQQGLVARWGVVRVDPHRPECPLVVVRADLDLAARAPVVLGHRTVLAGARPTRPLKCKTIGRTKRVKAPAATSQAAVGRVVRRVKPHRLRTRALPSRLAP